MDFEKEEISEEEIDSLGIKKKKDEDIESDSSEDVDDDSIVDTDEEEEEVDEGLFGDDKELENYMLTGEYE